MLAHFVLFVNLKNLENNTEAKKKKGVSINLVSWENR